MEVNIGDSGIIKEKKTTLNIEYRILNIEVFISELRNRNMVFDIHSLALVCNLA